MIEIKKITVSYPASVIPVFFNFNWEVRKGETWSVLGKSGCGKTTLLYLLAGLIKPASGVILIDRLPILRPRPKSGLILQDYGLLPWATVRQNAELGLKIRKYYGADGIHAPLEPMVDENKVDWLDNLGLSKFSEKYPSQLSGGQRQRTAIARTLYLKPDLLLMDEPFSSLDVTARENLQNLTTRLVEEQGLTLILVTHSIEEAALLGEKILLLGDPPNVKTRIVENTGSTKEGYRNSSEYSEFCKLLKSKLDAL